jgi:Urocanase Rossmann-like domain
MALAVSSREAESKDLLLFLSLLLLCLTLVSEQYHHRANGPIYTSPGQSPGFHVQRKERGLKVRPIVWHDLHPIIEPMPLDSIQAQTLRAFTLLHHLRQSWGGQLILNIGLTDQAIPLASNIVGAVCLSIEENPTAARAALRTGACDFVVNTLDEALRAMKNEVRQHKPLSVGLQGNQSQILREILERGLAPKLVTNLTDPETLQTLQSQGDTTLNSEEAATLVTSITEKNHWTAHDFPQPNPAALKSFDTQAAAILPPDDNLRRTWLTVAPRLFPRETPPHRTLWLTPSEARRLSQKP